MAQKAFLCLDLVEGLVHYRGAAQLQVLSVTPQQQEALCCYPLVYLRNLNWSHLTVTKHPSNHLFFLFLHFFSRRFLQIFKQALSLGRHVKYISCKWKHFFQHLRVMFGLNK